MFDMLEMVREFHKKYGVPVADKLTIPEHRVERLRLDLHEEEVMLELAKAMHDGDLVEIADALADSIYVLLGTALTYGIPINQVFAEVHRSNMTKDGSKRGDGKILKGATFEPPRIAEILEGER